MRRMKMSNDFLYDEDQEDGENSIELLEQIKEVVVYSTDWTVETILNQLKKQNIDLSPSFQRRDAWNLDIKTKGA